MLSNTLIFKLQKDSLIQSQYDSARVVKCDFSYEKLPSLQANDYVNSEVHKLTCLLFITTESSDRHPLCEWFRSMINIMRHYFLNGCCPCIRECLI